jgi:hypothetical protein
MIWGIIVIIGDKLCIKDYEVSMKELEYIEAMPKSNEP